MPPPPFASCTKKIIRRSPIVTALLKPAYPPHCQAPRACTEKKGNTFATVAVTQRFKPVAEISSSSPLPFPARPWHADICALYRRIWILRLRGRTDEAEQLAAHDWPRVIADLTRSVPDADQALAPILAAEAERMATAEAVVDLLGPVASPSPPAAAHSLRPPDLKPAAVESRAGPIVPKGIADFIDEMLADNRPQPSEAGR